MLTLGDSAIAMLVRDALNLSPCSPWERSSHSFPSDKFHPRSVHESVSHKLFSNVVHMTSKTFMQNMCRLGSACINLDHGAFRHCIQSLALRSDLAPILFLEAGSYDETPMTVRTTDDALDLKHVLQESAETSRAFAVAACCLVVPDQIEDRTGAEDETRSGASCEVLRCCKTSIDACARVGVLHF